MARRQRLEPHVAALERHRPRPGRRGPVRQFPSRARPCAQPSHGRPRQASDAGRRPRSPAPKRRKRRQRKHPVDPQARSVVPCRRRRTRRPEPAPVTADPTSPAFTADWIAVDWGSSNLRAWAIAADGERRARPARPPAPSRSRPRPSSRRCSICVGGWLAPGGAHRRRGLRHGRRPRRLGRGGLRRGALPAGAGRLRRGPRPAIRASRSASCRACARTRRPT